MSDQPQVPGPAVPGGVEANLGPFDEGLTDGPAYRGRTYHAALVIGGVVVLVAIVAVLIASLT